VTNTTSSTAQPGPQPAPTFPFQIVVPPPAAQLSPTVVVKFFAEVNASSAQRLMQTLDTCVQQGVSEVLLLISSTGGDVHQGVSLYNYIRALPLTVTTHNFGSVDSIAVVIFAAGQRRLSVPQARFLLHGVATGLPAPAPGQVIQLNDATIKLLQKSIRADQLNIAKIVAANSNRSVRQIQSAMNAQVFLAPASLLTIQ
jgi:ATP-dependent protease ClpP protease subunit